MSEELDHLFVGDALAQLQTEKRIRDRADSERTAIVFYKCQWLKQAKLRQGQQQAPIEVCRGRVPSLALYPPSLPSFRSWEGKV